MSIRTGKAYTESLRDGRTIYVNGERYLQGKGGPAKRRVQLFKLAWDMIGEQFGSRQ